VAIFDGAYHGAHDTGMIMARPDSPRLEPVAMPLGAGVPEGVRSDRILLPYRERAAFDAIRAHRDELALVMIEPVQSSNPHLDDDSATFLRELQEVCREAGVLFLLDEVITGFRLAFGGAQERLGLTPDLATYAKALGGGFPIGAVGGRADIMALFQGPASGDPRGIFSGGTFSGNIVTMAAGLALVSELKARRDEVYPAIDAATAKLADRINAYAEGQQMPVQMLTGGSLFQLYFQRAPIRSSRDIALAKSAAERDFYLHLLANGVLIPGTRRSFLSAAHEPEIVDALAAAIERSLDACREDALL
jgi:glutamate-1-semialdehyde 2,1-aminomutase